MSSQLFQNRTKQIKHADSGDHDPSRCYHKLNGKLIHYKPMRAAEGKETVQMYNNDGFRELLVPMRIPTEVPGIWSETEFKRLKKQARVFTQKDRQKMKEDAERQKIQLQNESENRKDQLNRAQLTQKAKPGSKLSEVEDEATKKNLYVLQRAFELIQENEDEVKKANGLILASKCLAIREAQVAERDLIQKELDEENIRLDMMMEQRRQQAIIDEDNKRKKRQEKNQRYVKEVSQQIKENEIQRLVEAERKEEDSRNINRAMIAMQREDLENLRLKRLAQQQAREELKRANAEIEHFKVVQKEEQRIADLRVQEFMKNKAEREAAREAEIAAIKAAKERETARLRAQQQKAQDTQAANDELNALRIQEEVEKEWREKELAAANRRRQELEVMKIGRARQLEDIRRAQAMEIERDEHEFHQVAKVQNIAFQKDQEKKRQIRDAAVRNRKELLKQINEKEREKIYDQKAKFEEGNTLRLEKEVRELNIANVLRKKVVKLRENKVPEKSVKEIERQLKL